VRRYSALDRSGPRLQSTWQHEHFLCIAEQRPLPWPSRCCPVPVLSNLLPAQQLAAPCSLLVLRVI
jgi:hypothetical protein